MTPRQFVAGLTVSYVLIVGFYSWVLFSLLRISGPWVVGIMAPAGTTLAIAFFYGYQRAKTVGTVHGTTPAIESARPRALATRRVIRACRSAGRPFRMV